MADHFAMESVITLLWNPQHGLAMALLDRGASLGEIGDVLRHRCARSTTAYARYDDGALRPLARPWPVPGGGR